MFLNWLENHLLPCPFKALTGMDCPGCGMQRSLLLLIRGDFFESVHLYPPLIPILCTFIFLAFHLKFKFSFGAKTVQWMFIFSVCCVVVSYLTKMILAHHSV